jgi:hypothetical protein
MKGATNAGVGSGTRRTALTLAVALLVCLPSAWASGQRPNAPRPSAAPRYSAPRMQPNRSQVRPQARLQSRPQVYGNPQYRGAGPQGGAFRAMPGNPSTAMRPTNPGTIYQGQGYARPAYPGPGGTYAPPGHLGAWLNAHRGIPAPEQERMLHNDPSFNRLPAGQQQRLVQQLNRVDQMPEAQRERRLARAENLERLSPQERSQVQESARRWTTLPADRQTMMKGAFRDLRAVPPDQRETVLNSARYQNAFSPEERGILSNMLRVEPYEAPR